MTITENVTFNLSKLGNLTRPADICLGVDRYSPECLNKWFCPQINSYIVKTAFTIIILYVLTTWLLWAYWRFMHDKIEWDEILPKYPIISYFLGGDPRLFENKVKIEIWIRDKLEKLMLGFLLIIWWFYR